MHTLLNKKVKQDENDKVLLEKEILWWHLYNILFCGCNSA